ncbi:MAG: hypothetical protein QOD66_3120 [Solirubrobacteraceae bacterium]|jgi:hypothetical protein|nr:hypothetical protein [Solirubrobacteraceae bacterium]
MTERFRWALGLAILGVLLASAPSAAAASGWSRPFKVAAPVPLDVVPAQIAFSAAGAAAVGYGVQDEDNPADSIARVVQRRARSRFGAARQVAGEQQILSLAYGNSGLELLGGASEAGHSCCSQVHAIGPARGSSFGPARTLFSALAGATDTRLLKVSNRLLAVAATERGVWVAQSAAGGARFAAAHRLSAPNQLPQSLDAIAGPGAQSIVAWTARTDQVTSSGPRGIYLATGSASHAPNRRRLALTVPAGHSIDEVALAQGAAQPTLAWIESWFDRRGAYHAQVKLADVAGRLRPQGVSAGGELAAGLAFAADAGGDQALTWKACDANGDCATRVVLRRAKGRFGSVQHPGAIDASQNPVAAVTLGGRALVGWIHNGHVFAAGSQTTRLSRPSVVSPTGFGADLTIAASPRGGGLAVWTQGTLAQSVIGANFGGR